MFRTFHQFQRQFQPSNAARPARTPDTRPRHYPVSHAFGRWECQQRRFRGNARATRELTLFLALLRNESMSRPLRYVAGPTHFSDLKCTGRCTWCRAHHSRMRARFGSSALRSIKSCGVSRAPKGFLVANLQSQFDSPVIAGPDRRRRQGLVNGRWIEPRVEQLEPFRRLAAAESKVA